ncbi:MAG: PadR family transcriptional regulator [Pseudonocardiaceae bacterium]
MHAIHHYPGWGREPHEGDEHPRRTHHHGGRRGGPFGPDAFRPGLRRDGWGGRGARRSRGDVRTAVLALLAEQPMHGYQIIQEIGERSGGSWRASPGSVYPTVSQLADEGLVRTEKADGRSVVHLTEEGRRHTEQHREVLDAVWSTVDADAEDGLDGLRAAGRGLAGAVSQIAEVGTPIQVAQAVRLLDEARRSLYLLLAGDAPDGPQEPTPES